MTELAWGSNVAGIETTATYDPATREFVIHTPTNSASKFWIGGAGQHGKVSTVFAQLTVGGVYRGPHVFVVRLRDDRGALMPGVRIKDLDAKVRERKGFVCVGWLRAFFSFTDQPHTHSPKRIPTPLLLPIQMGLNGVDNGQIWFDRVRVPRTALLNRYADVSEAGEYSSPIPTVSARFGKREENRERERGREA